MNKQASALAENSCFPSADLPHLAHFPRQSRRDNSCPGRAIKDVPGKSSWSVRAVSGTRLCLLILSLLAITFAIGCRGLASSPTQVGQNMQLAVSTSGSGTITSA